MIIFYKKATGQIVGTVDGRVHTEDELKIRIGKPEETAFIVINWKPVRWFDKNGLEVGQLDKDENGSLKAAAADFAPDHKQAELVKSFERNPKTNKKANVYHYKVDIKTKTLILK